MSSLELSSDDVLSPPPEDATLLNAGEHADEPIPQTKAPFAFSASRWQAKSPRSIVLLVAVIKFFIVASGMTMMVPLYRLIEDAVCHAYYEDDSRELIEEMKCKEDDIQSRLAFVLGWCGLLNAIMTLLVAYPYGTLADKIGRKTTALLSYGGLATSFFFAPLMLGTYSESIRRNPYILMFGSLWLLVGGGVQVLMATLYAIAADVSNEKDKASHFLYLTFGTTAGGLVGPLIAGVLMEAFGPWLPIYGVIAITPAVFCLFFFIPETLTINISLQHHDDPSTRTVRAHIANGIRDLRKSMGMLRNVNIQLLLVLFLTQNPRFVAYSTTLTQYLSKHFKWKLAETTFLLSPLGILNLVILVALPRISDELTSARFGLTSFKKDLFLTKASTFILLVAALIEGVSHNVVLFIFGLFIGTFGGAESPLARAAISHHVEPEYTTRLYALIGMVEILGSFIGGPVLAWFFDKGLKLRGIWQGLPWFYVAILSAICLTALMFVRPPPPKRVPEDLDTNYHDEESVNLPTEPAYRD